MTDRLVEWVSRRIDRAIYSLNWYVAGETFGEIRIGRVIYPDFDKRRYLIAWPDCLMWVDAKYLPPFFGSWA